MTKKTVRVANNKTVRDANNKNIGISTIKLFRNEKKKVRDANNKNNKGCQQ